MNTGDIILLNAYANLKKQYKELGIPDVGEKELIKDAIFAVSKVILSESENNTSLLTKNSNVFSKVQIEIGNLTKKYDSSIC